MYAQDFDGLLPPANTKIPRTGLNDRWARAPYLLWWDWVLPYLRDERLLYCPSCRDELPDYMMNAELDVYGPWPLDNCTDASQTILIVGYPDVVRLPGAPQEGASIGFFLPETDRVMNHFHTVNACFMDGHVKPMRCKDLGRDSPLWKPLK